MIITQPRRAVSDDFQPDEKPRRPHRATGRKPPGGARPGAGRPEGSTNALPMGTIQAIKALNLRVPEGASDAAKALANRALERVVDVLEEGVDFRQAGAVLKAATLVREEICGPMAQKHEVGGKDGGALVIEVHKIAKEHD